MIFRKVGACGDARHMVQKIRLIRYFAVRIMVFNALFSAFAAIGATALVLMMRSLPLTAALLFAVKTFCLCGSSGGFVFGVLCYAMFRRREFFMYQSHGLSRWIYFPAAYVIHVAGFTVCFVLSSRFIGA